MHYTFMQYGMGTWAPVWLPVLGLALVVLVLWSVFWKGLALWHSAQRRDVGWFVVMLVVNTAGILEIIYLFAIAKRTLHTLFTK